MKCARLLLLAFCLALGLAACTAHYPVNASLQSVEPLRDLTMENNTSLGKSDELFLILTFSGGGTRAAALSYGVLEALADTRVTIDGQTRRLLDEVDAISSVSGGSFTAAYFGLFGDRIFEDYETRFLKHDVQTDLTNNLLSPLNWPALASTHYERSDLAADYYDKLLFEGKTFGDMLGADSPVIAINATDVGVGAQFTFIASQFAPICSDLASYRVARAVTASSAVPGPFSSIILKNYAGTCDYQPPQWVKQAMAEHQATTRRFQHAKRMSQYLNQEKLPYIHLVDGGISDNLGVRTIINSFAAEDNIWNKFSDLKLGNTQKIVVIAVNAQTDIDKGFAKKKFSVPLFDLLGAVSSVPLANYSFESMELLRNNMAGWGREVAQGRCEELKGEGIKPARGDCTIDTFLAEVSFDMDRDEKRAAYLKKLPTSFRLEDDDVDLLMQVGREILLESPAYQRLVMELQGP